jgi:para-aminobenzoate synthetase component 1
VNPDGTVSETNTANILFIRDKTVIIPSSPHVLPGIMQKMFCKNLQDMGYVLKFRKIWPKDIQRDDVCFITNSLIGVVPVLYIDDFSFREPDKNEFFEQWVSKVDSENMVRSRDSSV